ICIEARRRVYFQTIILCKIKKALEDSRTFFRGTVQINVTGIERCKHLAAYPSSGEQHIESSFAAFAVNRTERHAVQPSAGDNGAIANTNENNVALIALHVLDVLDEQIFRLSFTQKLIQRGVLATTKLQKLRDEISLCIKNRAYTER